MPTADETFALALQFHQAGDLIRAEQLYRQALRENASHVGALSNLGVALAAQGRFADAIASYQTVLRIDPKHVDAQFNLGNAYRRMGRFAEASGCYQAVLRLAPNHSSSAHNLGLSFAGLGRFEEAIQSQRRAIQLEPDFAEAHNHLADALVKTGKVDEGIQVYRRFIELRPNDARGYHNIALAIAQKGMLEPALATLEQALRLNPNYAEGHNSMGVILEGAGRAQEAFQHYQKAVQLKPQFPDALNNLGTSCTEIGLHDEAIQYRRMSLQLVPHAAHIHSNLLLTMHYSGRIPPAQLLDEHKQWAQLHADRHAPGFPPEPRDPKPERKLKIGYVSSDLRAHTVAAFVEPLLESHNRDRVHITCFANVSRPDAVTERLKAHADHWVSISNLNDDLAADAVRDAGIDILVDLNGHTAHNRLLLFARKPAAIQATLFGYPDTTGMAAVDYRITDVHSDPPGMTESLYVEALCRLPEIAWCYRPPADAPAVGPLPLEKNGFVTFGSFNNLAKITPEMIALWSTLLHEIPRSKLILLAGKGGFGADRMLGLFARQNITADRVQLLPRQSIPDYFALHQLIDLYLDPFPYNGGVTSCDALWMGTPMITLAGGSYYTRQGATLMTNLGLPQFVAGSPREYLLAGLQRCADPRGLKELRSSLRERMNASPIMDAKRYAANLENAYRNMWKKKIAG